MEKQGSPSLPIFSSYPIYVEEEKKRLKELGSE
jgi:hypothetical protein